MLQSETWIQNYQLVRDQIKIETQAGYVQVLKVNEEKRRGELYLVDITARVSRKPLLRAYRESSLPQALGELDYPRILLLFSEKVMDKPTDISVAESALRDWLTAQHLDVVDREELQAIADREKIAAAAGGDSSAAAALAALARAELVIRGNAWADVDRSAQSDPARARLACETAIKKAVAAMTSEPADSDRGNLMDRLTSYWMAHPAILTLRVAGLDYEEAEAFVDDLSPARPRGLAGVEVVDTTKPETYRPQLPFWERPILRNYSEALTTFELRSGLRPRRAIRHLVAELKKRGWKIVKLENALVQAKKAG